MKTELTPSEINVAIAELVGLKVVDVPFIPSRVCTSHYFTPEAYRQMRECYPGGGGWKTVPDYHGDLNAMHEAVETLRQTGDQFQWLDYTRALFEVVWGRKPTSNDGIASGLAWDVIEATAAQRARAFLAVRRKALAAGHNASDSDHPSA